MALGSIKIVITLAALSLGATLFDIGLIIAGNATVSIVASIGWGRLSDYFGLRVRFLVIFFLASAPLFVLLGLANAVWQLIALFTVFAVSTAGIQPIAAMYAVESNEGKNWQKEIVKYNSYWNTGVIAGLVVNSLLALVMPLSWLLYIAAGFCVVSALIVWRTAKEPDLPLEREAYAIINVQDEEQPTTMSVLDYFDIRKIPRGLRRLKPVHLLFIACLIHWTGVFSYTVGEVPFMAAIGMSASLILSVNVAENVATVISFSNVVPRVRMEYQRACCVYDWDTVADYSGLGRLNGVFGVSGTVCFYFPIYFFGDFFGLLCTDLVSDYVLCDFPGAVQPQGHHSGGTLSGYFVGQRFRFAYRRLCYSHIRLCGGFCCGGGDSGACATDFALH